MVNQQSQYPTFKQLLLEHLQGKKFKPCGEKTLLARLKIAPQFHALCKQILKDLVQEKTVIVRKKQYLPNRPKPETVTGVIHLHPKGFGFVELDPPSIYTQDIFIPKHLATDCVDKDRVEVEVDPNSDWAKGPEGKIVQVLERTRTHVGAILHHPSKENHFFAYSPLLGSSKLILVSPYPNSQVGDRVVLKMTYWGSESSPPTANMVQVLGSIEDPSIDIECALKEFDIPSEFSKEALMQATLFGTEIPSMEGSSRVNLQDLECVTIDPKTAKDFDDALSLTVSSKGIYTLGVHIADVAHYVPPSSPLDLDAVKRGNSTYFPGKCVPMLPYELSNELCSLKPYVSRLTISVMMDFSPEGNLLKTNILRTVIKSQHRFSYEEAKDVLDKKIESPHLLLLEQMVKLASLLKAKRNERGSIDFSLPDLSIVVDKEGNPLGFHTSEYDITHQLVEEFMLKANEVVALHLIEAKKPSIFRTHEAPSPNDQEDFYATARSLGFFLPPEPTRQDVQVMFQKAKETPFTSQLAVSFIRSMKLAQYSPKQGIGHYGLSLDHYCHFTSPIRRYSDLVTQRLLFDEEKMDSDFEEIAKMCSDHERLSFRAESSVKLLKKFRLLSRWMQEDPGASYEAVITKIKPFGISFDVKELLLEGFLHISSLENDYFLFNSEQNLLVGERSGQVHKVGDVLKVIPVSLDLILLEAKWELSLPAELKRFPSKKPRKTKKVSSSKKRRRKSS
ncbi:MAG: ribonuclease R [Candidatus Rhabdochlamydia sp.]